MAASARVPSTVCRHVLTSTGPGLMLVLPPFFLRHGYVTSCILNSRRLFWTRGRPPFDPSYFQCSPPMTKMFWMAEHFLIPDQTLLARCAHLTPSGLSASAIAVQPIFELLLVFPDRHFSSSADSQCLRGQGVGICWIFFLRFLAESCSCPLSRI